MKTAAYMGEHDLRSVTLSATERATIARAAAILTELRSRLEDGREDWDEETIVDVAMAAHTCAFVATEGSLPIY